MANSTVTAVYRFVIDDVITNVRRDFEDMGVDETIMHELQRSWEAKIAQSRVTPFQAPEATGSVETYPFEEPSTYEQAAPTGASAPVLPSVALPGPSGPARARLVAQVAVPGLPQSYVPAHVSQPYAAPLPPVNFNYRNETTPAASLANVASASLPGDSGNAGRPLAHAPPRNNSNNRNIALPGGGRNGQTDQDDNIPQTDGATESSLEFMTTAEMDAYVEKRFREAQGDEAEVTFTLTLSDRAARKARREGGAGLEMLGMTIGQVDGEDDDEGAGDDADLGSDLDDSDGEIDEESDNIVLCQYDKVSRTKNKWKCVLKDGIMLINGRDYLFHKATGDFEW